MKRTQVYLDEESRQLAIWQAKIEGTNLSQVIRASIKAHVKPKKKKTNLSFIERIEAFNKRYPDLPGSPTDVAMEHDHYLYSTPKKYTKK